MAKKQRQPTQRAHACARSHGDMFAKGSLVYLFSRVSYAAYQICVQGGMKGGVVGWGGEGVEGCVCVAHSVAACCICEEEKEKERLPKRKGITE